jgi:adenylate kinase family enzyme
VILGRGGAGKSTLADHAKTADIHLLHSPHEVDEFLSQASRST